MNLAAGILLTPPQQEIDLQVVECIHIGQASADGFGETRTARQQLRLFAAAAAVRLNVGMSWRR